MVKTYTQLSNEINKMIKDNKTATTSDARNKVIGQNMDLVQEIQDDLGKIEPDDNNRFVYLMNRINDWVLKPKGNDHTYKTDRQLNNPKEQAATIHDNIHTSGHLYQGRTGGNYYLGQPKDLKPTASELKVNRIKLAVDNIKDLQVKRHNTKYNRITVSKAIRTAQNDLNLIIKNYRGINHQGRVDNMVTPKKIPASLPLTNRSYAKYVITHSKNELPINENIRLDKITADQKLGSDKTAILKDLEKGYSQRDTAERNHVSQSTVRYYLNKAIDTVTTKSK